jgi:hypothetical protein
MAIAAELIRLEAGLSVQFVSYATGAEAFRRSGAPVIDLGLPENNGLIPTLCLCHQLIVEQKPTIIFAHEEFAALVAAKLANVPSVFISAWLPRAGTPAAEALTCAAAIIVIENPGIFPVPPGVFIRPLYTGPILRNLKYTVRDRHSLREELKLSEQTFCIAVVPGGSSSEEQFPIADTVLTAFMRLKSSRKQLYWISTKDHPALSKRFAGVKNVEVISFCDPIERLLAAADVVITKGTRGVTLDAEAIGVRSISLSPGQNPVDDVLVPRMHSNLALNGRAVDGEILLHYLEQAADTPFSTQPVKAPRETALVKTARLLLAEIRRRTV